MKERNEFLEMDGLVHKTNSHEWFNDKVNTIHAQREDRNFIKLPHITCYVVRNIDTGEYYRVVLDNKKGEIVYDSKSSEEIWVYVNKLKIVKHFK
jgi:hypothetical protein